MAEIIIAVDRGDHAETLPQRELLQVHAYERVRDYLKTSALQAKIIMRDGGRDAELGEDTELPRVHDAIFIEGGRGTGKTSFILNLRPYLKQHDIGRIHSCTPIDPTLLNEGESFLNVVIAKLHDEFKRRPERGERHGRNDSDHASYYEALEAVSHAIEALDGHQSAGMDRILTHRNGLGLQRHLHRYYREVCKALNCELMVMPVDDADMAPYWAFEILDVIRRYLACPLVVPVVTGDIRQYTHIVASHFAKQLNTSPAAPYAQVPELAEQYLDKVLPVHRRVRLFGVAELLEQHDLLVDQGGRRVNFETFHNFIRHLVFRRTNREETDLRPKTTRGLIQWLIATARPVLDIEELRAINSRNSEEAERRVRDIAWNLRESTHQKARVHFQTTTEAINAYWSSAGRWADYHRGMADLRLAAPNLADRPQQPLRDLIWFNPLIQPPEQAAYNWHREVIEVLKAARNPVQDEHKFPNTLVAFPSLEPYSVDAIFPKRAMADLKSPAARFLARAFSYDNYYSSYQTTNLVLFGRAFEIVVTSLFGVYDRAMLARVLRDPPYHSYFHAFPTKNLDVRAETETDVPEVREKGDEFIDDFVEKLDAWHKEHVGARPSAQLVQRAMNKAFTMLIQLKLRDVLTGDSLAEVVERFRRILLNAFGSFEKSVIDGDRIIVRQNVALETRSQPPRLGDWTKDPSYRFNVEPLLEFGTVTNAISKHPLFALVQEVGSEAQGLKVRSTSGGHKEESNQNPKENIGSEFKPGEFLRKFVRDNGRTLAWAASSEINNETRDALIRFIDEIRNNNNAELIKSYIKAQFDRHTLTRPTAYIHDALRAQNMENLLYDWISE